MIYERPQPPKNEKQLAQKILTLLQENEYCTRRHLAVELDVTDRTVRLLVSRLAQTYPIISSSKNGKGYKLAKGYLDLTETAHAIAELESRIIELDKRLHPLLDFKADLLNSLGCKP